MRDSVELFSQPYMQEIQFVQDREYPLRPSIQLPEPTIPDRPFLELVCSRRTCRNFGESPLTVTELSALLFAALGETGRLTVAVDDGQPVEISLRSIPSGGALHPTRIFVATLKPSDIAAGIYHFDAPGRVLELVKPLAKPDIEALFGAFPIHPAVVNLGTAGAIFFITAKFWRPRAKYGPRGYRYCLQEAGSACQNLCLAAVALRLAHVVLGGFYDDEVHACLEIDGVDHAVITSVAAGALPPLESEARHDGY
jgi:SagB-type dehydrogenase family enzyme